MLDGLDAGAQGLGRVVRIDRHALGDAITGPRVDALVDPVDGRRGLRDAGREDVLDRVRAGERREAERSAC